jgi:hypothetical protein
MFRLDVRLNKKLSVLERVSSMASRLRSESSVLTDFGLGGSDSKESFVVALVQLYLGLPKPLFVLVLPAACMSPW